MRTLSTGHQSTLGNYLKLAESTFGERSAAVKFLKIKIDQAAHGEDEEVIADEGQMIFLLMDLNMRDPDDLSPEGVLDETIAQELLT